MYKPSRYRCRLTYDPPRGPVFDAEYYATGAHHLINRNRWELRLDLDLSAAYAATGTRWDAGTWRMSTWAGTTTRTEEAA